MGLRHVVVSVVVATLVVDVEVLGAVLTLNPPKPYVGA